MFGRALTSVAWGVVADHYGRKPVIIMGSITVLVPRLVYEYLLEFFCSQVLLFVEKISNTMFSHNNLVCFVSRLFSTLFSVSVLTSGWPSSTTFLLGSLNGFLGPIKVLVSYNFLNECLVSLMV